MYDRFLFVGLGGSGGKTLRFLKDQIRRWMKSYGITGDVPAGWQFLHIDTPPNPDGDELNHLVPQLGPAEYLSLTRPGDQFAGVQKRLDEVAAGRDQLRTWRVNPDGLGIPIQKGAGQYRAVGATIGTAQLNALVKEVNNSLDLLDQADTRQELAKVWHEANPEAALGGANVNQPYVVVVSSLAGGTGAGLLGTVCDLLRASRPALGDNLFGILYTSDVFGNLAGPMREGVHANALAALSEIMNGHWWRGAPIQDPWLASAGAARPIDRSGSSYPFLVGITNAEGVNFGTFDKLFEVTGRALLAWVISEAGRPNFMAYTIGNWKVSAAGNQGEHALMDRGLAAECGNPPFSALGFARLSLGTDHFERYSVQRLTTEVFHHLVDYQAKSEEAQHLKQQFGEAAPGKLAEHLAVKHAGRFRQQADITEEEFEAGLLRQRLTPSKTSVEDLRGDYSRGLRTNAGIGDSGTKRSAAEWRRLIGDAADDGFEDFRSMAARAVDERSRDWVEEVEKSVVTAVEEAVVHYGLWVAQRLCKDAADYLRKQVTDNLNQNIVPEIRKWWESWQEYVDDSAIRDAAGKIGADDRRIDDYVADVVHYRFFVVDWLVAARAAELATELATKLLEPLADTLDGVRLKFEAVRAEFPGWAQWEHTDVPASCGPLNDEFALIDHSKYYETFSKLLAETFPDAPRRRLRERLIKGGQGDEPPIKVEGHWVPDAPFVETPASNLGVTVLLTSDRLERLAETWLREPNSPFGAFVGLGLRDAFTDSAGSVSPAVADWRKRFRSEFKALIGPAIAAAKPLVNLDPRLEQLVGKAGGDEVKLHFSALPFDGLPIQAELMDTLAAQGIGPGEAKDLFNADSKAQHISITAQLSAPRSVLAISSLLTPITGDWAAAEAGGQGAVGRFWQYRRSRILQRFVPCPQEHLRAMVRGWFTGRLLGLIRIDGSGAVSVAREDGDSVTFPDPTLSQPRDPRDPIAVVLESLCLSYVEAARIGGLEPLRPYDRLLELGCSGRPDDGIKDYESLNRCLSDWIESGTRRAEALELLHADLRKAPTPDSTDARQHRREALAKSLDSASRAWSDAYKQYEQIWAKDPGRFSKAPLWTGLWPLIGEELDRIREAVSRHDAHDEPLY